MMRMNYYKVEWAYSQTKKKVEDEHNEWWHKYIRFPYGIMIGAPLFAQSDVAPNYMATWGDVLSINISPHGKIMIKMNDGNVFGLSPVDEPFDNQQCYAHNQWVNKFILPACGSIFGILIGFGLIQLFHLLFG